MSSKEAKANLAAGAKAIRKAEKEAKDATAAKPQALEIPELTRPMEEIVRDRVTLLSGNVGVELSKDTTLAESLAILDWTTQMSDHVGFMIGDVLNFGQAKFGHKYTVALNQTGRARSTLKNYSWVASQIPPSERVAALSFSHYKEVVPLERPKRLEVLALLEKQAAKGELPTKEQLRIKVQKLTPRKKKAPKKITSGKGKRKVKPEPPPYQPPPEELAKMDSVEDGLRNVANNIEKSGVAKIVAKCDNGEKRRWLGMLKPLVDFYNELERLTGY